MQILYTAEVTGTSGRNGHIKSSDGVLDLDVRHPQALGGPKDGQYTNPEQLFAAGYAACFGGAIMGVGKRLNADVSEAEVTAKVSIGKTEVGGFGLGVELRIKFPHITDMILAQSIVEQAHQTCPYSIATRGNIEVKLVVL
jgi:Ohr subfamily peroxiredoxin